MFVDYIKKVCYIHVPRCAGVAITMWLKPHLSTMSIIDLVDRHWSVGRLIKRDPYLESFLFLGIIRHPKEILESMLNLHINDIANKENLVPSRQAALAQFAEDKNKTIQNIIKWTIGFHPKKCKGFYETYFRDHEILQLSKNKPAVLCVKYEELNSVLIPVLQDIFDIQSAPEHINTAPKLVWTWTDEDEQLLNEYFSGDLQLYR